MNGELRFSARRSLAILLLAAALGCLLAWQALLPFRERLAERYLQRGDSYMVAQDFEAAAEQYRLALRYTPDNQTVQQSLSLAERAPVDIAAAHSFYLQHQVSAVLAKLDQALKPYDSPRDALLVGIGFYQKGDFSYAQYPLQRAVQLDPEYPEAWHYLSLDYAELAKVDPTYQAKAAQARQKQDDLTPKYLSLPSPTPL